MAARKILHGNGHDWQLVGDVIESYTSDGRVSSFERWWRCGDCPDFQRHRTITIIPQYTRGPLAYKGKATPMEERVTSESEGVADIISTTTNVEIKRTLKALGY